MLKGLARGGPLDRIEIQAQATWTGFISSDPAGRYKWNPRASRWDWVARNTTKTIDNVKPLRGKPKGKVTK